MLEFLGTGTYIIVLAEVQIRCRAQTIRLQRITVRVAAQIGVPRQAVERKQSTTQTSEVLTGELCRRDTLRAAYQMPPIQNSSEDAPA